MEWKIFFLGSLFMGGLIASFGPQNLFVLHTGLQRRHTPEVVLICIAGELLLATAGLLGMQRLFLGLPQVVPALKAAAAVLLLRYALSAIRKLMRPTVLATPHYGRSAAVLGAVAVTFLNPYVYLDTLFLLGTSAASYGPGNRWWFGAGAVTSSCLWYTALGFGAQYMAKFARSARFSVALNILTLAAMAAAFVLLLRTN